MHLHLHTCVARVALVAALAALGAVVITSAGSAASKNHVSGTYLKGDVNLAKGVLESQFGFSPSRATDWTTGVCSYADKPSTCYLTKHESAQQSNAQAQAMGVPPLRLHTRRTS
jgi:hypothetical protein